MHVSGRCHCGKVAYEAEVSPEKVMVCHCRDCQILTGSAYRVIVPAAVETFHMRAGPVKHYVKTAESGNKRAQAFCADCGTPVYSSDVSNPKMFSLRVGCLDQRAELEPRKQNWCDSAMPWSFDLASISRNARQ